MSIERLTYRSPRFNNPVSNGACKDITCTFECDSCKINDLIEKLCAYEDSGLEPEDLKKAFNETAILKLAAQALSTTPDHLRDLLQAEQTDRLVVLPCKVGDHVWIDGRDAIVTEFFGYRSERYFHAVILGRNKHIDIPFNEIGKTVFLDREDAEAAMAQKGGTHEADSV